jgi:hypothetical protein
MEVEAGGSIVSGHALIGAWHLPSRRSSAGCYCQVEKEERNELEERWATAPEHGSERTCDQVPAGPRQGLIASSHYITL